MEIKVDSKLRISNPTPAIEKWCRENLIMDNPDYYKKEAMGKWTGNIPKQICLYERAGDEFWLPFGCIRAVWKMCVRGVPWKAEFSPLRRVDYDSHINLYDYQEKAVNEAIKAKNGVLVMPCGSGKTQCGLEIISRIGGRALWLTHTQDLLVQSRNRAESILGNVGTGVITEGKAILGKGITFATVQTLSKLDLTDYRDQWDIIIVDECMPGETLIDTPTGSKALKNLHIDDIITSYNWNEGRLENKRITHIFKSKAHDIVKVKLSNGEEIICTKNHPIYTRSGRWIEAERLVQNDYVLRLVWKSGRNGFYAKHIQTQGIGARLLLLLQRMFCKGWPQKGCLDRRTQTQGIRNNEKDKQSVSRPVCKANEKRQSDEKAGSAKSGIGQAERNRTQATDKMWKWCWLNSAATKFCDQISRLCGRLHRISNTNKNGKRFRLSDLLQSGYSNSRKNDRNRNRWQFALCGRKAETGREKRAVLEWIRVESVEVQEQTSDGTFGGLCSDGYVYNIEVEDNNNYFANGILVHNCQHCCGSPTRVTQFYKVVSNLSARHKFGLTATPKRADGLERAMFALLGGIVHAVSREEVAHTTCPVVVRQIETGWMPDYDCILMGDGMIDYSKVIDSMIHDEGRFHFVAQHVFGCDGPAIVLANRVEYLKRMCDLVSSGTKNLYGEPNWDGRRCMCLSGMGQSKKAKAERKEALRKLNDGELDCIFATYQLAKEGLDVPNLQYIVFATPEKDETTVIQAAGRVGRKADGKDCGVVLDFVDNFGMYRKWARQRISHYKKIDAEVVD